MRKYIDVNNIPFYIRYVTDPEECKTANYVVAFRDEIDNIPAEDVAEVRHGEWVKPSLHSQEYCSQCGETPKMIFGLLPNYCPHCGAKMVSKDNNYFDSSAATE